MLQKAYIKIVDHAIYTYRFFFLYMHSPLESWCCYQQFIAVDLVVDQLVNQVAVVVAIVVI